MNKNTLVLKQANASLVHVSNQGDLTEFKIGLDTVLQVLTRKVSLV